YKDRIRTALGNQFLRKALDNFASAYKVSRAKAFEGIDLDALKDQIAEGKDQALTQLESLFLQFKARAEAAGAIVHLAGTAQEANEIIAKIGRDNDVKTIVKSKSMTAEETHLNDHLEAEGFKVTETDLGEWIIQLRHEGPSHMVMPAIHLSRQQVGTLFGDVTKTPVDLEDIDRMVKVARKELRPAFLAADMGISGANMAIAETGTLGIISNEGNARLTTTLPRVHVALVGLEKLVPDLSNALRIVKVLPKNATGQALTSYVTWITGAVECAASATGKKILHIVFLDNGRLELARDPIFSEALRCIRCGACSNVCPVYGKIGGHTLGHVYIGAIGLILTYFYHGKDNARAIVRNCLNCQACKSVCPVNIDLPYLIKKVYGNILKDEGAKPAKNTVLSAVMKNRRLFHTLLKMASTLQKPLVQKDAGVLRHLPFIFGKAHDFRTLPALAEKPFRDQWPKICPQIQNPAYRVALFGGCVVDFVSPEQALSLVRLLSSHNVQMEYPLGQSCCGLPAVMMAEEETAAAVAVQNLEALDPERYDYILVLCASCGSHLKDGYSRLLAKKPEMAEKLRILHEKLIDFSSFMVNILKIAPGDFIQNQTRVAYHSPCHLCRGLGVTREPRELLKTAGLDYVPCKDEDVCCGFGGSYSLEFPEISSEILRQKLDHVENTGAEVLVTDCPGCVLQLRGGMDKRNSRIQVRHIAEVVADNLKNP
ncbi:MAG: LUD domain-containing protein, partial [Deltaproteobacteria bacterium]|nr:LUD domain-containing protein [Deltaproteobacteria bacterium]